ncbi:GNAT family N-acetyltransferase [Haloimpatiens sp. FM7315]|uniref:GNAT family N-acetyltransferase n=1 Tax=Haloimpatiens sp. FM7315 TaxID=3298609 RepID=UPI00370ADEF7
MIKKGETIYIKSPEFFELSYIRKLWADEKTMRDVGGAINFSKDRYKSWYEKMVKPGDGKNVYCLIFNKDDTPVGEVSFHAYDKTSKTAEFNVKIESEFRRRGYGKEAIKLMLQYYFEEFGGQVMLDEVINEKGQEALKKFGFEVVSETKESINFKMTKENFKKLYKNTKNI